MLAPSSTLSPRLFSAAGAVVSLSLSLCLLASQCAEASPVLGNRSTDIVVFQNARFTFHATGPNACGTVDKDTDFVAAINTLQWGNGEHCFETIEVQFQGKVAQAKITDECPGCPFAGLNFSPALFEAVVGPLSLGAVNTGTWGFTDSD
ncbi:hypothetical protein C8Q79DRAFT_971377 [Trametes meyenii]|nr:hypothetical protein C8Q79DRAFT_971377 [Trametes meyenii]